MTLALAEKIWHSIKFIPPRMTDYFSCLASISVSRTTIAVYRTDISPLQNASYKIGLSLFVGGHHQLCAGNSVIRLTFRIVLRS